MHKQWIGCCPGNFRSGRAGYKPEAIVMHRTGGALAAIAARSNQARSFSSAHYAVAANGAIHQYVEETDTAFHAGVVVNPTWALLKPGKNPNLYTVAIEMEGSSGAEIGKAQYDAAADLIAEIASRWNFPPDSDHVVLHSEIRAGRKCPDNGFDRKAVLDRIGSAVQLGPEASSESEVRILKDANVREGAPGTNVRVVRVAPANTVETVYGFTDQGERLQGNSYWYRLGDGNYLWAGATDAPNPLSPRRPEPVAPPAFAAQLEARAAQSGIERIDALFKAAGAAAITATEPDRAAIGAVQDLLTGLGFPGLPNLFSSGYGIFGQKTDEAIRAFQGRNALPSLGSVDGATLQKMIASPAPDPRAVQVYLTLVLGFPFTGMHRVLSLVAQMEGVGKFAALNRNTDRAGLSFGLIQWAQKPGRLCEVLAAMSSADRDRFVETFGAGDASVADALVAYCRKPYGGVDPKTGEPTNPAFHLAAEPWLGRFRQAALIATFQQAQVRAALTAFQKSYANVRRFAPALLSERGAAFMLDVANQFGDAGAEQLYRISSHPGMAEMDVLAAIAEATVARVEDRFKMSVRTRRDQFLETRLLSDQPFAPGA